MAKLVDPASQKVVVPTVDEITGYGVVPESAGGNAKAVLMAWQPSSLSYVKLNADPSGNLNVVGTATGVATVAVSNFPATQAISAVSLPLPTGASTEASLVSAVNNLSSILTQLTTADTSVIDTVHSRVHQGRFFSGSVYNSAVINNGTVEILVQLSTQSTHVQITSITGGDSLLQIFEGTTFSVAGSAVTISNHNRSSAKVFNGTVTTGATLTTDGTQIDGTIYAAGGEKNQSSGGTGSFNREFDFAPNTNYLIRVTNISGATAKMCVIFEGYQPNL